MNVAQDIFYPALYDFPVRKTIDLGIGPKNGAGFRKALLGSNYNFSIGDWGEGILANSAFRGCSRRMKVDLVFPSVGEIGFTDGEARQFVIDKVLKIGYHLCPAETGPQLRLKYPDQTSIELLEIGMEPIRDSDGTLDVFTVESVCGRLSLNGDNGDPNRFLNASHRLVLIKPRVLRAGTFKPCS